MYEARSSPLDLGEEKKAPRPPSLDPDISEAVSVFLAVDNGSFRPKKLGLLESGVGGAGRSRFSNFFANSSAEKFIPSSVSALSFFWAWWRTVTLHVESGQ